MSDGKWFLFTARPPERAAFVLEACDTMGAGQDVYLVRDDQRLGIGPCMDSILAAWPDLDFYGWLADDTYPQTEHWDLRLSEAAGRDCLSFANDGGYLSPGGGPANGEELSSGLCWGGDLIRAAGSWSLGFHSAYIDLAWLELLRPLDRLRYEPKVVVRHDNWRTGRREADDLDQAALARVDTDRDKFAHWREGEAPQIRERIGSVCVS